MTLGDNDVVSQIAASVLKDVDYGGRTHVWEQEVYGLSLYLPLNLAVSLKTTLSLKNCSKKKMKKIHIKF